jgi:fused signal recognition particle receptor
VDALVIGTLRKALLDVLGSGFDLTDFIRKHERPVKILFTGVNGTGKTTTVAKVGAFLKKEGFSVVIGAGDTYRAGAIEQIDVHAERIGIKVIQHQPGADPSAVLFDAVQYATSHKIDVVLADTAGRFHTKANLMSQLEKIRRVMKPDLVIYVDEAVAGNDAVVRAAEFEKTVGADAVVLTKADMDSRGGAAISIAHTIGKPLLFLGVGQGYDDIMPFAPAQVVEELLGGAA